MVYKTLVEKVRGYFKIYFCSDYNFRIYYYNNAENNSTSSVAFESKQLMKLLMYISNNFNQVLDRCVKTQAGLMLYRQTQNNLTLPPSYAFPLLNINYFRVSSDNSLRIGRAVGARVVNGSLEDLTRAAQRKYYQNKIDIRKLPKKE